ncbi:acyl-CoA dehydrogenase family protein [Peptoniphilus sp. GNH]|nr:acyl-CoA dehydrogenase family protein [Peptoniphilus sp. GNH]
MNDFDFMLNDEQIELRNLVREFAQKRVKDICREAEKTATVPDELVKEAMEMGLNLVTVPEEYGGLGLDRWTYAIIREELAKGDSGFASRVFGFGWDPLKIAGNDQQKDWVSKLMLDGGILAFALTESESGSNAGAMKTRATKDGSDYIINGGKTFITNGDCADVFVIFAVTDKEKGTKGGITAFLLPSGTPGLKIGEHEDKMGIRCVHTNSLYFDNMRLNEKFRLGEEGEGYSIAMKILAESRPCTASSAVGVAQSALEEAIKYSKERVIFGKEIWKHQAVGFMLAEMEMRTQSARQMVWAACKSADAGKNNIKLSSIAKTMAGDAAMFVAENAVQVLGGYGYSREYPVEKLMRDAKIYQIFEGTNQIQRMIISGRLCR